jgi:hypothetical protein
MFYDLETGATGIVFGQSNISHNNSCNTYVVHSLILGSPLRIIPCKLIQFLVMYE